MRCALGAKTTVCYLPQLRAEVGPAVTCEGRGARRGSPLFSFLFADALSDA